MIRKRFNFLGELLGDPIQQFPLRNTIYVKKGCWSRQIKTYTALYYSSAFTNTVFVNFVGHLVVAEVQAFLWVGAEDM